MKIRKIPITRYIITGKQADRAKAFDYCRRRDLRITLSGPLRVSQYEFDFKRFKIVAEDSAGLLRLPS